MIRVLICDDHDLMRAMLTVACTVDGDVEVVGEAENGSVALARLAALRPDVVLLDVSMPEVDGLEVLSRLPEVAPATRAVVLSGFGDGLAATALELGAAAYLTKGTSPTEIRAAIRAAAA